MWKGVSARHSPRRLRHGLKARAGSASIPFLELTQEVEAGGVRVQDLSGLHPKMQFPLCTQPKQTNKQRVKGEGNEGGGGREERNGIGGLLKTHLPLLSNTDQKKNVFSFIVSFCATHLLEVGFLVLLGLGAGAFFIYLLLGVLPTYPVRCHLWVYMTSPPLRVARKKESHKEMTCSK